MNRRLAFALALALPLAGLAASWAGTHHRARQGVEWDVPIAGYDPRDLLRGHYVIYRYDWPGLEGRRTNLALEPVLCLDGEPPRIARVYRPGPGGCEGAFAPAERDARSERAHFAIDRPSSTESRVRAGSGAVVR